MEKGCNISMDASIIQDVWDWEVLPDEHRSFYAESRTASHGHGGDDEVVLGDQETDEPILYPSEDPVADECKDIGVDVVPADARSTEEESMPPPTVTDHGEDEEETFQGSDAKEADDDDKAPVAPEEAAPPPREFAGEEEEIKTKKKERAPECVVFSVGKLRVNGIGALCSFGVAAATVCVFLVSGRVQHQQKQLQQQQQQKIQLQFLGDDKRMQQVVQQTSRLNQAMSSMMGAGASTRAKISFGGFYDGF